MSVSRRLLWMLAAMTSVHAFCMPGDACWPGSDAWDSLNTSVGGRLMVLYPVAAPCFANPNGTACQQVIANYSDPYWRAAQPAAMQYPNLEEDSTGAACFDASSPCAQGSVPPYGVAVEQETDITAALAFAQLYNIRVVVKSTGHELQGRSTAPGALLVWLHRLQGITIHPPSYCPCPGSGSGPAVTTSPGNGWGDVYDAVAAAGYHVVGGSCRTVSSAGGYITSGGHSFSSPAWGLAVDNVLAFTAILANGSQVTASACQHEDLFWALRGGGGGSFAILTSATYALHPVQPVTGLDLVVGFIQGIASEAIFLDTWLAATPGWQDAAQSGGGVWAGYWSLMPLSDTTGMYFQGTLVYNGTLAAATASMAHFLAFLEAHPEHFLLVETNITESSSFLAWHDRVDPPLSGDATGVPALLTARMIAAEDCANSTTRAAIITALCTYTAYNVTVQPRMVSGGAVSAADSAASLHTSVTPAWRTAAHVIALVTTWPLDTPFATQQYLTQAFSNLTDMLRVLTPGGGTYFSESDIMEPDWQASFWGTTNYARLQRIKAAYDPQGVFLCWHCVEPLNESRTDVD